MSAVEFIIQYLTIGVIYAAFTNSVTATINGTPIPDWIIRLQRVIAWPTDFLRHVAVEIQRHRNGR